MAFQEMTRDEFIEMLVSRGWTREDAVAEWEANLFFKSKNKMERIELEVLSEIRDLLKAQHALMMIQHARFNAIAALMRGLIKNKMIDHEIGLAILKVMQPDEP